MGEAPAPTLPFLPRAWSYLARIHTGSRDTCLHMLLYVTLCYIMSENDFQIHFCFVFPLFIQNRVKLIWRQKLWKLSAIKKAPSSSKSKMKLGALFFSIFLMENNSPRFFALWFAIIITSTGIFSIYVEHRRRRGEDVEQRRRRCVQRSLWLTRRCMLLLMLYSTIITEQDTLMATILLLNNSRFFWPTLPLDIGPELIAIIPISLCCGASVWIYLPSPCFEHRQHLLTVKIVTFSTMTQRCTLVTRILFTHSHINTVLEFPWLSPRSVSLLLDIGYIL